MSVRTGGQFVASGRSTSTHSLLSLAKNLIGPLADDCPRNFCSRASSWPVPSSSFKFFCTAEARRACDVCTSELGGKCLGVNRERLDPSVSQTKQHSAICCPLKAPPISNRMLDTFLSQSLVKHGPNPILRPRIDSALQRPDSLRRSKRRSPKTIRFMFEITICHESIWPRT